jgi:hypothetical protein
LLFHPKKFKNGSPNEALINPAFWRTEMDEDVFRANNSPESGKLEDKGDSGQSALKLRGSQEMILILMGASGVGKTTIRKILTERTGRTFEDADDYHPEANPKKLAAVIPLNIATSTLDGAVTFTLASIHGISTISPPDCHRQRRHRQRRRRAVSVDSSALLENRNTSSKLCGSTHCRHALMRGGNA